MKTSNKKTLSFYSLSLLASLVLAGCATGPVPTEPEPKITEDVHAVMALPDVGSATTGPRRSQGSLRPTQAAKTPPRCGKKWSQALFSLVAENPEQGSCSLFGKKRQKGNLSLRSVSPR